MAQPYRELPLDCGRRRGSKTFTGSPLPARQPAKQTAQSSRKKTIALMLDLRPRALSAKPMVDETPLSCKIAFGIG